MNLVIDIGNTQIKVAVFEDTIQLYQDRFPADQIVSKIISITEQYEIQRSIVSHVSNIDSEPWKDLEEMLKPLKLDHKTPIPFENKYLTPKTLGVDRIALMAGAVTQFPKNNILVIDAGSCITFDFLNEYGSYFGGDISPGILMRYKAVNHFTANLPLLEKAERIPETGNSTENAIHRGVLHGVIQEIEGVISQYRTKYRKLTVVLTGGDTIFLAKNIKSSIFAIPNFLLEGLNGILIHNIDE